jgi:predicted DNA-binding transcriptional regulator AlpA
VARTDGLGTLLNMDGLVTVKELAARWGVTRDTARQRTLDAGFPQVIHLGPRLLRWRLDEVERWENTSRARARRRRTDAYQGGPLMMPARVA